MSLGKKVGKLRKAQKLSLRQVSEVTGVSPSQLSRIERDLDRPSSDHLLAISQFFGVKMEQLLIESVVVPRESLALAETGVAAIIENLEKQHPVIVTGIKIVRTVEGDHLTHVRFDYEEKE